MQVLATKQGGEKTSKKLQGFSTSGINSEGITILLIEQNAHAALAVADYGYVLETGAVGLEGPGGELLGNEHVRELYLGAKVNA